MEAFKVVALVVTFLVSLTVLFGIFIRAGKVLGNVEQLGVKLELLKAENKSKADEILAEMKAHTGDEGIHVNERLQQLREQMQEDFRKEVKGKLDEILRAK